MEPPGYEETHYRFGQQCRNCKFKDVTDPDRLVCTKYEREVMPHYVCLTWERDGVLRVH